MATQIGLKIGVDGEAEFRKSINGINDSFKTLKSEMAVVTSAFDKNDKAQEKLTEANKVLNKQIDLQKQKLSEVSAMLEKSRDKYGENDAKTRSWERTVNDATAELNKLERQLKENNTAIETNENKIKSLDQSTSRMNDAFGKLKVGIAAGIGAVVGIGYAIGNVIEGMNAMEDQTAQTNAVLKSTGGVSGMTADELIGLADAFEDTTKFAAEQTLEAENLLLTFTNIGKEVFPQATETLLDMAAAMGTDAKGGAIQLGKALNNPTEGISALTRVGVTFTDEQKNLIKALQDSGDMAGAQTIILQELQKEFGGSAEAAGETFSGQLEILKNSFGEASEELLITLMPTLQNFVTAINDNMPKVRELITVIGEEFGAGAEAFKIAFDEIKKKVEENAPAMRDAFSGVKDSWSEFFNAVVGDNEWLQNMDWGSIGEGFSNFGIIVGNVATAIGTFAQLILAPFILIKDFFAGVISGDLDGVGERFIGLTTTWQNGFIDIHNTAAAVFNAFGADIPMWTRVAFEGATESIKAETPNTQAAVQGVHDTVKTAMDPLTGELTTTGSTAGLGLGSALGAQNEHVGANAQALREKVKAELSPLPGTIGKYGEDSGQGYIEGLNSKEDQITTGSHSLVQKVLTTFRKALGIQSPSTEFRDIAEYSMDGWLDGWDIDTMVSFANGIVEDIKNAFSGNKFTLEGFVEFIGSGAMEFLKSIGIGGASFGGLTAPVSGGVTSGFGNRESFMTDSGEMSSSYHAGIDIGAAYGSAVGAAGAGTVTQAGWNGGYGNSVTIDHGNGLETFYAHLSEIMVSVGQLVSQLQTIGLVGSTGNSTGPHLHFGVYQDGVAIDPSSLFGFDVGSRYIPQDMVAMIHQGEMIVPKSENPYANSGGAVLPQSTAQKQPAVINLVLQNGSKLAEYLIDDINNMLGVKTGLAGRGMA